MLKELIILDIALIISVLVLIFVFLKKKKKQVESKEIKALEKKLTDAIRVEKMPRIEDEKFIGSNLSKKYHQTDCRFAKNIKDKEFGSIAEFKKKKYSPCGICLKK
jgi:hypothetical protein